MTGSKPSATAFFLIVICVLGVVLGATAEPELSPEKDGKIDLGITTEGQIKRGTFAVTNSGDSRLKIEHYMVNCTCVKLLSSPAGDLGPGESGEFKFLFDTTGLGGKESEKEVILFTNAPNSPHRIKISTQVRPKATYQVNSEEILEEFTVLVDVRSRGQFEKSHILGAKNVPKEDFPAWVQTLPEGLTVYIYSQEGEISDRLAGELDSKLQVKLKSLVGGYLQWKLAHESYLRGRKE
ncbi:DUF1573 domain-containing protein [Candidatus Bipolaricaulota bacterium]|nr:DUF1573 domain-containing protein [Candidatus Bipolaricaulota bacterium]